MKQENLFNIFMGQAPIWYKISIILFLILNPFLLILFGKFVIICQ